MAGIGGKTKGAGRKPAPEPLVAVTIRIPQSTLDWANIRAKEDGSKRGNKSGFIARLIMEDRAKTEKNKSIVFNTTEIVNDT
jgi:hypothetical protein